MVRELARDGELSELGVVCGLIGELLVAARARDEVDVDGREAGRRRPAHHVLDVRRLTAVLMDDDHARDLCGTRGTRHVGHE